MRAVKTDAERMAHLYGTVSYVGTEDEIRPWQEIDDLATSEDEPDDPDPVPSRRARKDMGGAGSGNFGHVGRPGEVGGSGEGTGASKGPSHADVKARLTKVTDKAFVPKTPTAVRAAAVVADVLEDMKQRGLKMPDSVTINLVDTNVEARVRGTKILWEQRPREGPLKDKSHTLHLEVDVPKALPADADLDDAVVVAFSGTVSSKDTKETGLSSGMIPPITEKYVQEHGDPKYPTYDKFAARTMRDVVTHEMGHVQAGHRGKLDVDALLAPTPSRPDAKGLFPHRPAIHRAMLRVSRYAAEGGQDEFIAEAFTRLSRGETLDEDSMKLYRAINGPDVQRKAS